MEELTLRGFYFYFFFWCGKEKRDMQDIKEEEENPLHV